MLIRQAHPVELDNIVDFQLKMALETEDLILDRATVAMGVERVLLDRHLGIYYVAEIDNRVIGSLLTTYEWSDWRNGTVLWIQSVYVDVNYRQNGVYKAMYKYIRKMVESDDQLKGIRLYVDQSNFRAQEVYTRLHMNGEHYRVFEWMK